MIIGDGPLATYVEEASKTYKNVIWKGMVLPDDISPLLETAHLGWNLLTGSSLNYYYSLANKTFDYIMHGLPVITMDYPEYRAIIDKYGCGVTLESLDLAKIHRCLDSFTEDPAR